MSSNIQWLKPWLPQLDKPSPSKGLRGWYLSARKETDFLQLSYIQELPTGCTQFAGTVEAE